METYHKIQTLFKRHLDGPKKGKMIRGAWTTPALEYLSKNQWEFTEKVDGTNIRIHFSRIQDSVFVKFGGRTDRATIPEPLLRWMEERWPTSLSGDGANATVGRWMIDNDLTEVTLFGEGYGNKIQNGGLYSDEQKFVLFDVKIGNFWLERNNVDDIAAKLGIDSVPTLGHGTLEDAIDIVSTGITFEKSGSIKRWGPGRLNSTWGDFEAEGIVARTATPLFDRKGERMITKIKAVDFR